MAAAKYDPIMNHVQNRREHTATSRATRIVTHETHRDKLRNECADAQPGSNVQRGTRCKGTPQSVSTSLTSPHHAQSSSCSRYSYALVLFAMRASLGSSGSIICAYCRTVGTSATWVSVNSKAEFPSESRRVVSTSLFRRHCVCVCVHPP